jgi:hypothetical protein
VLDDLLRPQRRDLVVVHGEQFAQDRVGILAADRRCEAVKRDLDPNLWFDNVEFVAADPIRRETVQYVRNIYKYYIAYKLILAQVEERKAAAVP